MKRKIYILLSLVIVMFLFVGCAVKMREVTLPERIKSIYIPMCENKSYRPGLEEYATNYLIEEFVADGRLNVVEKKYADALLEVTLELYRTPVTITDSEDFPIQRQAVIVADVSLWEPNETKPTIDLKDVTATTFYMADPRRETLFNDDPRDSLMKTFAQVVVDNIFYGEYPQQKYLAETFSPIIRDDDYLDENPFDYR